MLLLWLVLAGFSAFIAYYSLAKGSYLRCAFASFWVTLFLLAIWIDVQGAAPTAV